ncbi:hypothetical protein MUK42_36597 [Musa troglodytarum]|uniref:Uncharacterized protein n=1 Tax=Musa troglodytarum TaxID=320322 RepID=A0A9E7FI69_9LILI|nr:hypothetical protein MUK42_36597 [Musa troglodytarum]
MPVTVCLGGVLVELATSYQQMQPFGVAPWPLDSQINSGYRAASQLVQTGFQLDQPLKPWV